MKKFIKENWKFLLIVLIGGIIGGYCTGLYSYDILSEDMLRQLQEQNITKGMLTIITTYQYGILYGFGLAILGIILSKKINLWKEFKFDKKAAIVTLIITVIAGITLFPGDKIIFGQLNEWVNSQYTTNPTIYKIIAELLTGGITEEVMLRLFLMSLVVFIISKVFYRKKEISTKAYIIANIITAILFAALHLPLTAQSTTITPVLLFRCFLFNGGFGLCFGYLYRKYGIGYAMISHGFTHLIADTLMIIFI